MSAMDPSQLNGLALAYIGDAVYELYVRTHFLQQGYTRAQQLHQETTAYVSANAQAKRLHDWLENQRLNADEETIVRRGRNAKSGSVPKNTDAFTYSYSTGFEALVGYLHLRGHHERLNDLLSGMPGTLEEESSNERE
ncbi:ribonuclease III [Salicibibacter halophilus]|uniref:Mini-ribonuclease 3 n=1 Tax=Salicibibacter halophilus TaxID=2502791 RepID=A0A514LI42_9BACI|nr:Mini-ribonuclease 3 [Salicibibacter halophilus]QDI91523.1 ribonuclease III [Salicibibacter halophilus]